MPYEPRNKTGRTLRQQIKAAADATAAEQAARKGEESSQKASDGTARSSRETRRSCRSEKEADSSKGKAARARGERLTKRHATEEQVKEERKLEHKSSKLKDGFHPVHAVAEVIGNMGLGYRILVGIVVFVLVVFAVLYPIGCTYYQAMRQQQQLEAVLDAVNDRNDKIDNENKQLETDEGVENQAREEYGWVKEGENATVITNGGDDASSDMPSQVDESKIEPPHTWYYDILDIIFQSKV